MAIKHFYPVCQKDGSWRIWLIDCEGIFEPVKIRHVERERRSVIKQIRKEGGSISTTEIFAQTIENGLFADSA